MYLPPPPSVVLSYDFFPLMSLTHLLELRFGVKTMDYNNYSPWFLSQKLFSIFYVMIGHHTSL